MTARMLPDEELHAFQVAAECLFEFGHPPIRTIIARTGGYIDYAEIYIGENWLCGGMTPQAALDEAERILARSEA